MRRVCGLLVFVLAGCANPWRDHYVSERPGPGPSAGHASLVGMEIDEIRSTPAPLGEVRLGRSEFVSASGPSTSELDEFAREIGANTVYWGRTFQQLTNEVDYRTDYRPASRTTRTIIKRADGTRDEVISTSDDWGYDRTPVSRTDAWYRYEAVFFAPTESFHATMP